MPEQTTETRTYSRQIDPGTQTAFGPPMSTPFTSTIAGIWSATASDDGFLVTSYGQPVTLGNAAATNSVTGKGRCWTGQAGQEFTVWVTNVTGKSDYLPVTITVTSPVAP